MTGMCDVTTCTYIVNISELTFHRLAPFLLKIISGCLYLDARFLRMLRHVKAGPTKNVPGRAFLENAQAC